MIWSLCPVWRFSHRLILFNCIYKYCCCYIALFCFLNASISVEHRLETSCPGFFPRQFSNILIWTSSTTPTISLRHLEQVSSTLQFPDTLNSSFPHAGQLTYFILTLSVIIKVLLTCTFCCTIQRIREMKTIDDCIHRTNEFRCAEVRTSILYPSC